MKKIKRKISLFFVFLFAVLILFALPACNENSNISDTQDDGQKIEQILAEMKFEFETAYTEEEHIQRIRQRTEERFSNDLAQDKIKEIHVEIIYSYYTEDPEWFLVEVEYKEPFENKIFDRNSRLYSLNARHLIGNPYQTTFKHIIGRIVYDKYLEDQINSGVFIGFVDGPSVWRARGFLENKKFYATSVTGGHGIEKDGRIESILRWQSGVVYYLSLGFLPWESESWCTEIKALSKEEQATTLIYSRNYPYQFFEPGCFVYY